MGLITTNILFAQEATNENLTKLYAATFDRTPDSDGLNYWLSSNLTLEDIAISFFDQSETKDKYPDGFSDIDFIDAIYNNLFDRNPEQEGLDYWQEELSSGSVSKSTFILAIINGAKGNDADVLTHKTRIAIHENSPKKIIFVGDSITIGIGLKSPSVDSYPSQLANLLVNSNWSVENYGITSTTILKKGDPSYWNTSQFKKAKSSNPNIVVIFLGSNDLKPKNWKYKNLFVNNYSELINTFTSLDSKPKVFLVHPTPSFGSLEGITNKKITQELIPKISSIGTQYNIPTIDLHSPFTSKSHLFPDTIHPDKYATKIIAQIVYENIF